MSYSAEEKQILEEAYHNASKLNREKDELKELLKQRLNLKIEMNVAKAKLEDVEIKIKAYNLRRSCQTLYGIELGIYTECPHRFFSTKEKRSEFMNKFEFDEGSKEFYLVEVPIIHFSDYSLFYVDDHDCPCKSNSIDDHVKVSESITYTNVVHHITL